MDNEKQEKIKDIVVAFAGETFFTDDELDACVREINEVYNGSAEIQKVTIFIDGACKGNPGPGKSLALFKLDNENSWKREKDFEYTTNNRAEYEALLLALKELKDEENYLSQNNINKKLEISIYTDSKLIVGHLNENWRINKNKDLVDESKQLIKEISKKHSIEVIYIPRNKNEAGIILENEWG